MPEREGCKSGTAIEFPCPSHLSLSDCPKLKGNLPSNLPCLTKLNLSLYLNYDFQVKWITKTLQGYQIYWASWRLVSILFTGYILKAFLRWCPSLEMVCENLEFPTHESLRSYTALEHLKIQESCCSLTSFPLGSPLCSNGLPFGM